MVYPPGPNLFSLLIDLFNRGQDRAHNNTLVVISRVLIESLAGQEGDPGTVFMAECCSYFVWLDRSHGANFVNVILTIGSYDHAVAIIQLSNIKEGTR